MSAIKEERVAASKVLTGPKAKFHGDKKEFIEDLRKALYASKIISYAQGYQLMRSAAKEYKWNLNYGGIALMWRGGCIIRSAFFGKIKEAFDNNPNLDNLLLDPFFKKAVTKAQDTWRKRRYQRLSNSESRCRASVQHWPITTAIVTRDCLRICCRHSVIISAHIPTNELTNLAANFSTQTGQAEAAAQALRLMLFKLYCVVSTARKTKTPTSVGVFL